jgi:hypothetical protein
MIIIAGGAVVTVIAEFIGDYSGLHPDAGFLVRWDNL